jgi:hypothetical protein
LGRGHLKSQWKVDVRVAAYGVTQLLGSYGVHLGYFRRFATVDHHRRSNHQLVGCSAGNDFDFELLAHLHSLK